MQRSTLLQSDSNPSEYAVLKGKKILVAPLNWGLGHATRCIPLIRDLTAAGARVYLASDGESFHLLRAEFPELPLFHLPGYNIRYAGSNMILNIALQWPRIVYAVRKEKSVIDGIIREFGIEILLSDNRYGCYSKKTKNILITHQLYPVVPQRALQWCVNMLLNFAFQKFDRLWVPDTEYAPGLTGKLSHPAKRNPPVDFIGILSRMTVFPMDKEYDVAVVLSGPEPQRTWLRQILVEQAMELPYKFIFVEGRTRLREHHFEAEHIEVVSFLTSEELNKVLLAAEVVVCRSGYSSIMDLFALGKRAVLIPTPGQTEQEYLARMFGERNIFLIQPQMQIDLKTALEKVRETSGPQNEIIKTKVPWHYILPDIGPPPQL